MSSKATAKPKEIIEEINKLRADPILYSKKVEEYSQYFTDKILKLPNLNVKIRTQEGSAPYLDTIEYLKTKEKKNALVPSKALCEIAQEIADNLNYMNKLLINMALLMVNSQGLWILVDSLLNKSLLIS